MQTSRGRLCCRLATAATRISFRRSRHILCFDPQKNALIYIYITQNRSQFFIPIRNTRPGPTRPELDSMFCHSPDGAAVLRHCIQAINQSSASTLIGRFNFVRNKLVGPCSLAPTMKKQQLYCSRRLLSPSNNQSRLSGPSVQIPRLCEYWLF